MTRTEGSLGAKYSLLREVGHGGMGSVFAAVNTWTGRRVAIKVLHPEYASDGVVLERFWHEARAASRFHHPHIVDVLDLGLDDPSGTPFIVQEYLEGEGLDRLLARSPGGRLEPQVALKILLPVIEALQVCHDAGVLHRDIKPSNVFLVKLPCGEVLPKLIDFGVSKSRGPERTLEGATTGTPFYMSPEQVRGERDLDGRADVWAMGVVLCEVLTSRRPIEGDNANMILARVLTEKAPRVATLDPSLPQDLCAVLDACLSFSREGRPGSMRALADALLACEVCRDPAVHAVSRGLRVNAGPPTPTLPPIETVPELADDAGDVRHAPRGGSAVGRGLLFAGVGIPLTVALAVALVGSVSAPLAHHPPHALSTISAVITRIAIPTVAVSSPVVIPVVAPPPVSPPRERIVRVRARARAATVAHEVLVPDERPYREIVGRRP